MWHVLRSNKSPDFDEVAENMIRNSVTVDPFEQFHGGAESTLSWGGIIEMIPRSTRVSARRRKGRCCALFEV